LPPVVGAAPVGASPSLAASPKSGTNLPPTDAQIKAGASKVLATDTGNTKSPPVVGVAPVGASPSLAASPKSGTNLPPTDAQIKAGASKSPATETGRRRKVLNLAVSDLVGKGVSQPEADLITEQVRASLLTTGTFKVMERSMMDQIMKEQGFQGSGSCDTSECLVSVGRILGVQNLVVGSVGRVGKIFMINTKLVDVGTGEVLKSMTETCECTIEELLKQTPAKVAASLDYEIRKGNSGTMLLTSQPTGANVYLDEMKVGTTPWESSLLDPGAYKLSLVLPDWKRMDRQVQVEVGKQVPLFFTLDRSEEWVAAQRAEENRVRQAELARQAEIKRQFEAARNQRKLSWRLGLSALSALCVGGGYYFQTLVNDNVTASDNVYAQYKSATDQSVMDASKSSIANYDAQAKKNRTMRNISYGLGAAALSSISFTFLF